MDSMSNVAVIREGDVQVMSAGTGVFHSEYNKNKDKEVHFLQIWVFPNKRNVEPRYDQISLADLHKSNELFQILSPSSEDEGVWIHQDAWFSMGDYTEETTQKYTLNKADNGLYLFVIEGSVTVGDQTLSRRDGMGISETASTDFTASAGSKVLLMEVPMN
jgi:redox-sensitive bicupin YhaK (pirin superfamily)